MAVRPSLAYFPSDNALLESSGLPWGVAVTPFSSTDERGSSPVTGDEGDLIPRCTSCFAYFSTLCSLHRWSWTCPICSEDNDLSADAAARYARDGSHDPPELRSAFVDLLLPGEEGEAAAATTPVYVAAIDLSSSEEFLELVKSALLAALEALSPGSLFGILTFSSKIGLYDVQGPITIVKNVFIPPDSDGTLHVDLKDVMPFCSFLAPVGTFKDRIAEALETIKPIASWERATTASQVQDHALHHTRGFGVAIDALVNYLSVENGTTFELARIFAFLSGPPNYGAGQLDARSNGDHNTGKVVDSNNTLLPEETSFYKNLAASAVQAGACVDLFAITNEYTDLTSLKVLSVESGGSLFLYSNTDESTLPQDIYKMLKRPYAFGCVLRLRTSPEIKIADSYGHFFPDPQYMHVQHINCCDSFASYTYDFEFEKDSQFARKSRPPILQIAFKYTMIVHHGDTSDDASNSGSRSKFSVQRRLRVRTIQYNTTANIWDLYDFVDPDVVLTILVHQVILASLSDVVEARLWLHDWLAIFIAQYNKAYKNVRPADSGVSDIDVDFSNCSQLQPLAQLVFAFLVSPLLQVQDEHIHPDYQTYLQCLFSALEPASLRQAICPTLSSYSSLDTEAEVHQSLSRSVFTSERPIFLLDAYTDLLVYYLPTASPSIPFPPPRDCLLRSTVDRLKQERTLTPRLAFIHGARDDTTTFEKYLIEDRALDGTLLVGSIGFRSFLEEVRSRVAEFGI
ncbi:protein transport protein Sec24B-like [Triticum urartu]|uniref:Sec23/sec24 transport family protein n=1 Tax=Triticum urartu TaxID=4572 RepID=A0A8R7PFF7_TRIUA|nr:protein transport protein Sec24B-like [Triticum urartu]